MNISPSARELLRAFNEWLEDSSKSNYRFELEEQLELQKIGKILDNQINMLIDYELKKKKENK